MRQFFSQRLPAGLEVLLWDMNPWWSGKPMRPLPPFHRRAFFATLRKIKEGLAPVTVLRGPRQVGKTTLQEQIIEHLLGEGVSPKRIFRVQFDDIPSLKGLTEPINALTLWFENNVAPESLNGMARRGEPAFIFLDEVQNVPVWSTQIKSLVDHHAVRILITGSSAVRIERGKDSLAGRISDVEIGGLTLGEVAGIRGWGDLPAFFSGNSLADLKEPEFWAELREHGIIHKDLRDRAFQAFSERGGYPRAQLGGDLPWEEVAHYLNESIIQRVIKHDLRLGKKGRKRDEILLEEVFRLCCRYAGQAPDSATFIHEIKTAMRANIGWQRILTYMRFLNDSLLIRLIDPLEIRLKRQKGSPKICLSDHSLRASWLGENIPLDPESLKKSPHLSDLAGHIAESVAGYFLGVTDRLNLAHFPRRPTEPEVDFVITVGERRIPVEVKYRKRVDPMNDTVGLRAFMEKTVYNAPFGLLITLEDETDVRDPRIISLPLSSLLLLK